MEGWKCEEQEHKNKKKQHLTVRTSKGTHKQSAFNMSRAYLGKETTWMHKGATTAGSWVKNLQKQKEVTLWARNTLAPRAVCQKYNTVSYILTRKLYWAQKKHERPTADLKTTKDRDFAQVHLQPPRNTLRKHDTAGTNNGSNVKWSWVSIYVVRFDNGAREVMLFCHETQKTSLTPRRPP